MSRRDFLVEIGTEELPPRSLKNLSDAFTAGVVQGLEAANLKHGKVQSFATPRRLAILRDPATQIVALSGLEPSPTARARMLWHEKAGGLLVAAGLPPAPAGKAYQLWAIAGKDAPVPAGVFKVDPGGTGSLRVAPLAGVGRVDVFAVTLEPEAGVPAPTGPMYLAGKSA